MSISYQAHICPVCHDDHSSERCKTADVRDRIAALEAERDRLAREAEQLRGDDDYFRAECDRVVREAAEMRGLLMDILASGGYGMPLGLWERVEALARTAPAGDVAAATKGNDDGK